MYIYIDLYIKQNVPSSKRALRREMDSYTRTKHYAHTNHTLTRRMRKGEWRIPTPSERWCCFCRLSHLLLHLLDLYMVCICMCVEISKKRQTWHNSPLAAWASRQQIPQFCLPRVLRQICTKLIWGERELLKNAWFDNVHSALVGAESSICHGQKVGLG